MEDNLTVVETCWVAIDQAVNIRELGFQVKNVLRESSHTQIIVCHLVRC